ILCKLHTGLPSIEHHDDIVGSAIDSTRGWVDPVRPLRHALRRHAAYELLLRPQVARIDMHAGGAPLLSIQGILERVVAATQHSNALAPKILGDDMRARPHQHAIHRSATG